MSIFSKKTFDSVKEVGANSGLDKNLGAFDLILFGLGGIIGTGVFVLTGMVAAKYSGPAVMLSYIIAGITCIFVALAYTELATMLPTSGSIYSYTYVAYGQIFAWLVGGIMVLELCIASAAVSTGWSGYMQSILASGGFHLPKYLTAGPFEGGIINLPALIIVALVCGILYRGNKGGKKFNAALVLIKLGAIFTFIVLAVPHFDATNWKNFIPYGFDKVVVGASILFFAFTGFGIIATTAEECKNPKRDITIGIIGSLVVSTIVYVIVGGLATGIAPFNELNNAKPLAYALTINNSHLGSAIVAVGAVCGMTTVIMMSIYGVSRIFYVMARDGLISKKLAKLHPKYDTPYMTLILFSVIAAILGAICPLQVLGQLSSMGALLDYIVIITIVVLFRFTQKEAHRPFKCPVIFIIAPIAFCATIYLLFTQIIGSEGELLMTGELLIYWFSFVLALYFIRTLICKSLSKK